MWGVVLKTFERQGTGYDGRAGLKMTFSKEGIQRIEQDGSGGEEPAEREGGCGSSEDTGMSGPVQGGGGAESRAQRGICLPARKGGERERGFDECHGVYWASHLFLPSRSMLTTLSYTSNAHFTGGGD